MIQGCTPPVMFVGLCIPLTNYRYIYHKPYSYWSYKLLEL